MSKAFFEVFPALETDDDLRGKLAACSVDRVTVTKYGNILHVYLTSPHLLTWHEIRRTETEIADRLFSDAKMNIDIRERFELSGAYTPQSLMELYGESFASELKSEDPVLHTLYQSAELSYGEAGSVTVTVPDGVVERECAPRLVRKLTQVLCERCGLSANVDADYRERKHKAVLFDSLAAGPFPDTDAAPADRTPAASSFRPEAAQPSFAKASGGGKKQRKDNHPDVIYGRAFSDRPVPVESIDIPDGRMTAIEGKIISSGERALKSGRHAVTFAVFDRTDTISVKLFADEEDAKRLKEDLAPGKYVRVAGRVKDDDYEQELMFVNPFGIMKADAADTARTDDAPEKRVELHMHTQMSDMDAVSSVKDIVKRAYAWGWDGIAFTDHGVVQALTDAGHVWSDLYEKAREAALEKGEEAPDRQEFFRVIPGAECYVVDDERGIVTNGKGQPVQTSSYVVFDLETTGFSPRKNRIIEIGAVRIENGNVTERFSEFVNPRVPLPYKITQLTGITDTMVADASGIEEVLPRFVAFCEGAVLVGHNVSFDISFINENCARQGIEADFTTVDTLGLSRMFFPRQARHTLDAVAKALNVTLGQHHRAVDDAEATAGIFLKFLAMLAEKQAETLDDVNRIGRLTKEAAKHLRPHHVTVLAKNTLGRVNLYTLVSESHLNYFYRYPLVPASLLREYREGLILGSADAHGDLFDAVMEDRSGEEIARIVSFYDYLEVQPPENYFYMIESGRYESVESEEDIREIIRRIVKLGEQYGKPVCATSDAHFLDPEAETFRSVLVEGKDIKGGKNAQTEQKGVKKDDAHAPLFLRTTQEMLDAFAFLGEEKAHEIVIENPHKILDMCDSVSPVRPDKCPPVIADSDKTLRKICYEKAHAIYGDPLPEIVEKRLEKELTSIIGNGFAVMYIIAQKLVWKSLEDGYIVGSRGSVGSSFVAFAAGITEVNALPPHYVCPKCKYSDFESDDVLSYAGNSGCDMPDRVCPVCGEKLYKDGFDIPFVFTAKRNRIST